MTINFRDMVIPETVGKFDKDFVEIPVFEAMDRSRYFGWEGWLKDLLIAL